MSFLFSYLIIYILLALAVPVAIVGGIVYYMTRHKKGSPSSPYNKIALSKEDALAQFYFLLATFFLGLSLLALNRDLNINLRWEWIFLITALAGLGIGYYYKAVITLAFSLIGLAIWWGMEASRHVVGVSSVGILVGLLLIVQIMYLLGRLQQVSAKFKREATVFTVLALIIVTVALLILSTQSGLSGLSEMVAGKNFVGSFYLTFSLVIFVLSIVGLLIYGIIKNALIPHEIIGFVLITIIFGSLLFTTSSLFLQSSYYGGFLYSGTRTLTLTGFVWAIVFNLAIFLELLGLILLGYLRKEEWLINFGAMFLFILVIIKYFDWFFTSLDKSLFFIGAGLILFLVGWVLERGRRLIISNINHVQ